MIDDRFHDFLLPKNLTCFMSSQLLNPQTFLSHFLFLDGLYLLPCSCLHLLLLTFFPWVLLQKMRLFCLPLVPHCLLGTHCRWRDDWKCTEHKCSHLTLPVTILLAPRPQWPHRRARCRSWPPWASAWRCSGSPRWSPGPPSWTCSPGDRLLSFSAVHGHKCGNTETIINDL